MITVTIPKNNFEERAYTIDIFLNEFLGIDYRLVSNADVSDYKIALENGNAVTIQDHFFSRFDKELSYLKYENLPEKVIFIKNKFLSENDLPVLYGTEDFELTQLPNGTSAIICGVDIFASAFLMLTRWEEFVAPRKDSMGRFSARESLAYKFGFLDRPIVNEYTEFLWKMLQNLGLEQSRRSRKFTPYLTHDVDFILRWYNLRSFFRTLGGDLLKRKSIKAFFVDVHDYMQTRLSLKKDPFDTFENLMSLSETNGLKSYFFMMSVEPGKQRNHYRLSHPFVQELFKIIKQRGHHIGFHPDINSYKNKARWQSEVERLSSYSNSKILFGRQHYLQFEAPVTWQIWDDMGMEWESSRSYDEEPGFRTGSCYSYSIFNFLSREKLSLKERSLIIMDKALVLQQDQKDSNEMETLAKKLIARVKSYEGEFVFLWHNSSFNVPEWKSNEHLYAAMVKVLGESAGEID